MQESSGQRSCRRWCRQTHAPSTSNASGAHARGRQPARAIARRGFDKALSSDSARGLDLAAVLNPLTQRRILKHGIAGTAEVLRLGYQYGQSSLSNRQLTLRVQAPGMDPYEVDGQWMVRGKYVDDLRRGSHIPVKVDPDDPSQVAIDWDRLAHPDPVEMTFTAPPQVTVHPQAVIDFSPTLDLRNDPELRRKIEAVVGHELTPGQTLSLAENDPLMQQRILQVVQEHAAGTADRISRLESLAKLRDSGALTEAEFAAAKAKILGGQ